MQCNFFEFNNEELVEKFFSTIKAPDSGTIRLNYLKHVVNCYNNIVLSSNNCLFQRKFSREE